MNGLAETGTGVRRRGRLRKVTLVGAMGGIVLAGMVLAAIFAGVGGDSAPDAASRADLAPDFSFTLYQGEGGVGAGDLNLSDLRGRPVVLNFWAGLCPPCRAEMPDFQAFYEEFNDRVTLVGVDLGQFTGLGTQQDAQELLAELGVTYPAGFTGDASVVSRFGVLAMPTTVFINSAGEVFRKWSGALNGKLLAEVVSEMLEQEPPAPGPGPMVAADTPAPEAAATGDAPAAKPDSSSQAGPSGASGVEPDPDYRDKLASARLSTFVWKTDFSRHTVPFTEIISGGPGRDGIPPIDEPRFITPEQAGGWLEGLEPVIAFELNGDARAYPLQILMWHEVVNDVVGGEPVLVTFCPLCNSAIVFKRTLDGLVHDFGVSGNLRHSDLIMWDRQTETWWQQLTGEGIVGQLAGRRLTFLAASIISWADFRAAHPDGKVLSLDTGFERPYGQNPYVGYDRVDNPPFLFRGDLDGRLLPKERVAALVIGQVAVAFPFSILGRERVVNYTVNGRALAVFFKPGTRTALGGASISDAAETGATGVFESVLDGRRLTFRADGEANVDEETGSTWDILGRATSGALAGAELAPIVHGNHFWFAWAAFQPDTLVYQGSG